MIDLEVQMSGKVIKIEDNEEDIGYSVLLELDDYLYDPNEGEYESDKQYIKMYLIDDGLGFVDEEVYVRDNIYLLGEIESNSNKYGDYDSELIINVRTIIHKRER
jgi:hypothetical protein